MQGGRSRVPLADIRAAPTFSARTIAPRRIAERVNLKRGRNRRRARRNSVLLRVPRKNPSRALKNNPPHVRRKDLRNVHRKHRPNAPRKEPRRNRQGRSLKLGLNRKRALKRSHRRDLSHRLGLRPNRSLKPNLSARRLPPHSVPMGVAARQPLRARGDMLPWVHLAEAGADRLATNSANIEVELE
jgi:hypothetical protein